MRLRTISSISTIQSVFLVLLRIVIGWHFLYEGIIKVFNPNWSSFEYLMDSKGWFSSYFYWMAQSEEILKIVDFTNKWALTIIGFALMLGLLTRFFCTLGALLLLVYYISHPAFVGVEYVLPAEGNYLWVNKNLIEMIALFLLATFHTGKYFGIDALFSRKY